MKTYFLTVDSMETARSIDPQAVCVRELPPAKVLFTYCCQPAREVHSMPTRFIAKIQTEFPRNMVRSVKGVIRIRTVELKTYKGESGWICHEMC